MLAQELSGGPDVPDRVSAPDVAIAGGGIVGTALAALLAEAGASVRLYEREAIAAAASGRNSGVLQHPLDEALVARPRALAGALRDARPRLRLSRPSRSACSCSPTTRRRCGASATSSPRASPRSRRSGSRARALRAAEPGLGDGPVRLPAGDRPPGAARRGGRAPGPSGRAPPAPSCGSATAVEAVEIDGGRATGVRTAAGAEPAGAVALAAGPVDARRSHRAVPTPFCAAVGRQRRGAAARPAAPRARAGRASRR